MIGVVNSVVAGTAVALLIGIAADARLGVAAAVGGVVALASVMLHFRYDRWRHLQSGGHVEAPLFPSTGGAGDTRGR